MIPNSKPFGDPLPATAMSDQRIKLFSASPREVFPDSFPDFIIEEILLRLPLSSVFRLRCVSKQWLSLTTLPHFIGRRELRQATFRHELPLVLLLENSYNCIERVFLLCSGDPEVNLSGFSLNFLPGFRLNDGNSITVVGSCEDLLLCCSSDFQSDYFVVNPFTRQWHALPPTLRRRQNILVGFVCDPASVARARKGGELQYRVVRVPIVSESHSEIIVEIFSSENGQWNDYAMIMPEGLWPELLNVRGVACSGIVYWKIDLVEIKVMGLDPFNPQKEGIFIVQHTPEELEMDEKKLVLGMCSDKLKMCEMIWSDDIHGEAICLNIYELANLEAEWRLAKVVPLLEIAANPSTAHLSEYKLLLCEILGFHPSNEDIIYLECTKKIICCNLKMMSLEVVSERGLKERFCEFVNVFPFELPWWPTPIPALPKLSA